MAERLVKNGRLVTVFGGSGFVGRHVVQMLAKDGWRVRIASRRPDLAFHIFPSGKVGQINAVQANLRFPESVAFALREAEAVVNCVGLLSQGGAQTFGAVHARGAEIIAGAAQKAGVTKFVQVSAIGADAGSHSIYAKTKAEAEAAILARVPEAVILRPSVVFGPEDQFFNRFAAMARYLPALPLIGGGGTKLQPVYVGDVAAAVIKALNGEAQPGAIYELGGPEISSFRAILEFILAETGRHRPLAAIPFPIAKLMGSATEKIKSLSFGLFPNMLELTADQVELLKRDNVVSETALANRLTLQGLGIVPQSYEAIVPAYLYRYRKTGQFARNSL